MTPPTPDTGGGQSGGRVKKRVGKRLVSDDLGNRPVTQSSGESIGRLLFPVKVLSLSKVKPMHSGGISHSSLLHVTKTESISKIICKTRNESLSKLKPFTADSIYYFQTKQNLEKINKFKKLLKLKRIMEMLEFDISPIKSFQFNERINNEQLIAFTHSSSWIGNVSYDTITKIMRVIMNGKAYNHCGVEQIDYDAFEGSPSKGEHWWRFIKDRFQC